MTNEEFQKLVLEKLVSIESDISLVKVDLSKVKATMSTKDDIAKLDVKLDKYGQEQQNVSSVC